MKKDHDFIIYFPDKFLKHPPPKKYFWSVLSQTKPDKFKGILNLALKNYKNIKRLNNENIKMTEEALDVFDAFVNESLSLLGIIIS